MDLFKISHAGREQLLVLFARHITVQVFSLPLRVAHLAQNPAIRAGDTLDSTHGAVGIQMCIRDRVLCASNRLFNTKTAKKKPHRKAQNRLNHAVFHWPARRDSNPVSYTHLFY